MYTRDETTNNRSDVVEMEADYPERDGESGLCSVGITGETDYDSMKDRAKRIEGVKERDDYRYTIPCDRCRECIEIRGFGSRHEELTLGMWCRYGEFETTALNTCNQARLPRRKRKKVIYDLRNAPLGFKEGLSSLQLGSPMEVNREEVKPEKTDTTAYTTGYKGGSEHYKRIDGDKEAEGTGKIPRRLMD